jgi:crotonobetainyl-CoA:carnitine CoA-transferase CaiB-like acyl-CoA transferase
VIRSPEEVLGDRHLQARGHFVELEHPELGLTATYPGAPFLAHASPWVMDRRPPLLGEHTSEVLAEWSER